LSLLLRYANGMVPALWIITGRSPGEKSEPKISYVKLFPKWGWVIGTGEYVNELNSIVFSIAAAIISQADHSMAELTASMQEISKASEETSKIIKTTDLVNGSNNDAQIGRLSALNASHSKIHAASVVPN
jgi:hypothetical protein